MITFGILVILYWVALVLFVAAATAFALVGFSKPRARVMIFAAVFLAASLGLAVLPFPGPPMPVVMVLGALSLLLAVTGGGPAASVVLSAATRGSVKDGTHGGILIRTDSAADPADLRPLHQTEVMRGGLVIGFLERLAVGVALMVGYPAAFAVVIAIKGVGRFTELAVSEARERFIIGTLVSLLWASAAVGIWLLAVR
ncbi:hypothetical protein ACSAGD_07800 [Paramicrobacterium sp. CJ85]|uniref:hypothetical protein n=1 Tax=Paramicrobacterium sp. CJ85 TaxID=3445355 RepID=UPI003F6306D1